MSKLPSISSDTHGVTSECHGHVSATILKQNTNHRQRLMPNAPTRRVHFADPKLLLEETIPRPRTANLGLDEAEYPISKNRWWQPHELAAMSQDTQRILQQAQTTVQSEKQTTAPSGDDDCWGIDRFAKARVAAKKRAIGLVLLAQQHPQHVKDPLFLWKVSRRCSHTTRKNSQAIGLRLFQEVYPDHHQRDCTIASKKRKRSSNEPSMG